MLVMRKEMRGILMLIKGRISLGIIVIISPCLEITNVVGVQTILIPSLTTISMIKS